MLVSRSQRRALEAENRKQPDCLREVPPAEWPMGFTGTLPDRVWRSRDYLVQEFSAPYPALARLSVCRTTFEDTRWVDGISWDDLQRLKSECGYGSKDAVEVFPSAQDVVNVANMRHLWVMREPIPFAWRNR